MSVFLCYKESTWIFTCWFKYPFFFFKKKAASKYLTAHVSADWLINKWLQYWLGVLWCSVSNNNRNDSLLQTLCLFTIASVKIMCNRAPWSKWTPCIYTLFILLTAAFYSIFLMHLVSPSEGSIKSNLIRYLRPSNQTFILKAEAFRFLYHVGSHEITSHTCAVTSAPLCPAHRRAAQVSGKKMVQLMKSAHDVTKPATQDSSSGRKKKKKNIEK